MNNPLSKQVLISDQPLNLDELNKIVQENQGESGASVIFTGCVRVSDEEQGLTGMTLEHYPGMTEMLLEEILVEAIERWSLNRVIVAHRVGYLTPGQPIVFVGTCGLHRKEAFESAEFIMDYLKNKATFWKKEHFMDSSDHETQWVEAKKSDVDSLERW